MKRRYRVGIIGCGRIASLLEKDPLRSHPCTHAGGYAACRKVEIVSACDINEERLNLFGREWGVKNLYIDYQEMLEKEELDIVSICSWTDTHCEMVIACSKVGVKGIICEKPMALNLKEADLMLLACERSGTKLIINHERRWEDRYRRVKELIDDGVIGEIRTIVGNVLTSHPTPSSWHSHYENVGGGPLLHDGTHLMDMLSFLGGEVSWVSGHVERKTKDIYVEDMAQAFLHFKSGAHATIEGGGDRNYFNFEIDVQGSKGRIVIGNGIMHMKMADVSPHYTGFMELLPYSFPAPENNCNPHIAQVEDLIDCIEKDKESISSGYEGRRALELVMAVYESARLDGKRIELPLKIKYSPLERMFKEGKI